MLWTSRYDWDAATTMGFLKNYGLSGTDRILAHLYTFAATYRYLSIWCNVLLLGVGLFKCYHYHLFRNLRKSMTTQVLAVLLSRCGCCSHSLRMLADEYKLNLECNHATLSGHRYVLTAHTLWEIYIWSSALYFISWLFSYSTNFSAAVTTSWRLHV
jgi:hypothetical protein